jgi:hypothetical protein
MLKSGIMEDGLVQASDEGVPQGGNLPPNSGAPSL